MIGLRKDVWITVNNYLWFLCKSVFTWWKHGLQLLGCMMTLFSLVRDLSCEKSGLLLLATKWSSFPSLSALMPLWRIWAIILTSVLWSAIVWKSPKTHDSKHPSCFCHHVSSLVFYLLGSFACCEVWSVPAHCGYPSCILSHVFSLGGSLGCLTEFCFSSLFHSWSQTSGCSSPLSVFLLIVLILKNNHCRGELKRREK